MKKALSLLLVVLLSITLSSCKKDEPIDETPNCGENQIVENGVCVDVEEQEPLSVSEVLLEDDLTYVTVLGVVAGYDLGKRHIIIEDIDGTSAIQMFKSSGYPFVKVGDEVLITGYRTFDRSTNRLDPESLEIISSGNSTTKDNPTVISSEDLNDWTNENRTNSDILFKWYTFENVTILSKSDTYTYIDNAYDDESEGRGLKIAIKNTSFYSADDLVEGMTYTITALVFGSSDDFFDESLDGTVLRLSILSADDITLEIEEGSANLDDRNLYYVGEAEPVWLENITVLDPTDGEIPLTSEMISENVDMTVAGDYEIILNYQNSLGTTFVSTIDVTVTDETSSVTEAIDAEVGTEMFVEGIIIGYGLDGETKKPIIIEDPANGNAVEIWGNDSYSAIEVGDKVIIYTGNTKLEKGQPRLDHHELISIVDNGNALFAPEVITDLSVFLETLETSGDVIYGRYTFTATMIDSTSSSSYDYFKVCADDDRCLKFAIYKTSVVNTTWIEGTTYTVTGVILGVSDPIDVLADTESTKSPTIRFGVMDIADILIDVEVTSANLDVRDIYFIGETEPVWLENITVLDPIDGEITLTSEMITENVDMNVAGDYEITINYDNSLSQSFVATVSITVTDETSSVTEAIDAEVGTEMFVEGIVIGYGLDGETKKPIIIEDPANGNAVEIWGNDSYSAIEVGDKVIIYTGNTKLEKDQPRLDHHELISVVDNENALFAPEVITNLTVFLETLETSGDVIYGRYTFTATMIDSTSSSSYDYFKVCADDDRCLKFAIYKTSVVNTTWIEGTTYTVTGVILGVSDPIDVLADTESTKSPTIRFGVMEINDIKALETSVSLSERNLYFVGETEPAWVELLTVMDPENGEITLTSEMITENVDMNVAGDYEITINYDNSLSQSFVATVSITVTDETSSVTEAIDAEVGTEMFVEGIVIGYGLDGETKKPIIIEDAVNGNAVEIWGNDSYSAIEVGDKVIIYTGNTKLEKGQPRLDHHELISIVDNGNALFAPEVITDLSVFLETLETSGDVVYGRYTFTATMIDSTSSSSYDYFKVCADDDRCLKFAIYKTSVVNTTWIEGTTYTVTGVILGVSDQIDVLADTESTKSPTIRFGVMDINDIVEEVSE
jgi:hypothetical protein